MHGWGFNSLGWLGTALMWLVPIGLIALGITGLVRGLINNEQASVNQSLPTETRSSAREILRVRYARGEIDREQYREMLAEIS